MHSLARRASLRNATERRSRKPVSTGTPSFCGGLTALVVEDSDRRVVLERPGGGQEVIPRHEVTAIRTGRLSMMPEGIEKRPGQEELADLFASPAPDRAPDHPRARPIPGAPRRAADVPDGIGR